MTDLTRRAGAISRRTLLKQASAVAAVSAIARPAQAADWPSRPVTLVVPYTAGGQSDLMARLMGKYLGEKLGKPFIVDNRAGGAGVPAAMAVASAAPDGCTLLFGPPAPYLITPLMQQTSYSFDSFTPINNFSSYAYLVAVKPSLPVRNIPELIAYAKANPGKLNYATAGSGSTSHLITALLTSKAGIEATHIPYKGAAPATLAVVSGEVDFALTGVSELQAYLNAPDKLRVIATTSAERLPDMPQLPTVAETIPGYVTTTWNGLVGPKGMPPALVAEVAAAIKDAAFSSSVSSQLKAWGIAPAATSVEDFVRLVNADKEFFRQAVKAANLA